MAATKTALRILGRRLLALDEEKARTDALLGELVTQTAPDLLRLHGVGIGTAATLLVTAGDNPGRLRSEAAWAHLCGTAPIPASSGKVTRWRLNRGGDRQATAALWGIVITRSRFRSLSVADTPRRRELTNEADVWSLRSTNHLRVKPCICGELGVGFAQLGER